MPASLMIGSVASATADGPELSTRFGGVSELIASWTRVTATVGSPLSSATWMMTSRPRIPPVALISATLAWALSTEVRAFVPSAPGPLTPPSTRTR